MTLLLVSEIYSVSYCSLLFPLIFIYFALIISFRPLVVLFNILPTMRQFKKNNLSKERVGNVTRFPGFLTC